MGCSASKRRTSLPNNYLYSSPMADASPVPSTSATSDSIALPLHAPLVHHPPSKKGDSHHVVSLKSTSYGYLRLAKKDDNLKDMQRPTWLFDELLSPDSVINTWEMMDGLEEDEVSDVGFGKRGAKPSLFHHLGPDGCARKVDGIGDWIKSKPLWKHLSEESLLSSMDPNVASSYRRALSSRQLGFSEDCRSTRSLGSSPFSSRINVPVPRPKVSPSDKDNKVVLFFTSLRGIRQTYEDCCLVRMILKGLRVAVDERDISMDLEFRKELQEMLKGEPFMLPQLFVGGVRVGGVEEVKRLNDDGSLAQLFVGFPEKSYNAVCLGCGDAGFVPCSNCNGSRRVFVEEDDHPSKCPLCNENGLIRCPGCCF